MIAWIRTHMGLVILGVGVLMMAIMGAYSLLSEDEYEDEDEDEEGLGSTQKMGGAHADTTLELPESEARKSRMLALKDSLDRSLQTRVGGVNATKLDRLAMPWFMLVGTEGSGKKSLLASTGLPLPFGAPVEVDSVKKDAGRWWLFEQAVVVEAPTARSASKVAPSDVTAPAPAVQVDISESWNNLLHLLRRERPDSPLNGIIVTVSCADLVGTRRKSPEEIAEQAELIRAFLEKTKQVLGVRLPVHLLITRCDVIPGFRSFAECLPDARRDDIFGWANPAPLERAFKPEAADAGFVEVRKSLENLHDELLAAQQTIADADGLFVFVNEFGDIQDALRDFLTKLMPQGERRPSLFFRGFYFTGDASEFAAKQTGSSDDEEAATLHISIEATEAETHALVFLRTLFAEKIFKEAGLARSAARFTISRDIRVVVAQAAAILIASLGGLGLWTSINGYTRGKTVKPGLRVESAELAHALTGVAIDFDALRSGHGGADSATVRGATDAAVISLVSELRTVAPNQLRSVFIPSSWLSPLPKKINASIVAGLQNLILPVMRERLQERANELLGTPNHPATGDDLDPSDPKSLASYLANVRRLNRNIARYNSLASPDSGKVADLGFLVDYLFEERPIDSTVNSKAFEDELKVAQAPKLTLTKDQLDAVTKRAIDLVASVADSAARELTARTGRPEDDLRALRRLNSLVELTDPKTGLAATVNDSAGAALGTNAAKTVQDLITQRIGVVAARILKDTLPPDQAAGRLTKFVLQPLFKSHLLDEVEGLEITDDLRPGQTLRWDIGQMELAFALRGDYQKARIYVADAFPAATQARLVQAFETQMRGRTLDFAARSQRFVRDTLKSGAEMLTSVDNLTGAASRVIKLAATLDTLKAGAEGKKLIALAAPQGEHVLGVAQSILDSAQYYAPHPTVVHEWRGGIPVGFAALGVADSGAAVIKLRDEPKEVQAVATNISPVLDFLKPYLKPKSGASLLSNPKLVAEWEGFVAAASPTPTTGSLLQLHDFITKTMGSLDVAGCQAALARDPGVSGPSDYFTMRRRQYRATMVGRCGATGSADAIAQYERIRQVFTTKLMGKFPFVDSAKAATANDADPAAIRELYSLYDAFAKSGDIQMRADPRVNPATAKGAFGFLDQLAAARPFFAPFIDSAGTRKSPEYSFVVLPSAGAAPQILHTGKRQVAIDDSTHEGVWGFGEAVTVNAADAPDGKPIFSSTGWWGLVELRMLQSAVRIKIYQPDTQVELKLPIFPQVAPEIPTRR